MSKETTVFVIGLFIFFVPFLGFPAEYRKWFLVGAGILLMIIGYVLRRTVFQESLAHESGERKADVFVESVPVKQREENPLAEI